MRKINQVDHNTKIALVTGASGEIGSAICSHLQSNTYHVVALDVQKIPLTADENITFFECDIRNIRELERIRDQLHHLDSIVNCAAINPRPTSLEHMTFDQIQEIIDVNLRGTIVTTKIFCPLIRPNGSIVNFSSLLANRATINCSIYSATKGAIETFTKHLAKELAPRVRVNCVSPGAIASPMLNEYCKKDANTSQSDELERIEKAIPMKRLGNANDVASAVLFLTDPSNSWITGTNMIVDGGDSL